MTTYEPGQQVWYKPWRTSSEDEEAWEVTYVRLDDDGHVVRFPDGGHLTLYDSELHAERPVLRKASHAKTPPATREQQ